MVIAVEYNYINPDRNSISGIVNNAKNEHVRTCGEIFTKIKWKYNIKFYDKIKNKTKLLLLDVL